MDRLAEISRPQHLQRNDATDFTRPQGTRTERREDGETKADERVNDRERTERAHETPERFSVRLAEQKAAFEPQESTVAAAETEPAQASAPETADDGKPEVEAKAQPGQTNTAAPKNTNAPTDAQVAPPIEVDAPVLAAAAEAPVKSESKPAAAAGAPPALIPAVLPVATTAAQPASAPQATVVEPSITVAPRADLEKSALETESTSAKIGAPRADAHANQVQDPNPNRETSVEAPKVEAPREAPAARSAQEVERAAEILRQIRVQITPQISEARIQLQPLELGRVSIHLTLENGRMKTVVRAEKTETLQAIQTHLPELKASLRQHGIDAQEFQLSLGFENRPARDGDKSPTQSNTRNAAREETAIERSPSLHAAVTKTGIDFYA